MSFINNNVRTADIRIRNYIHLNYFTWLVHMQYYDRILYVAVRLPADAKYKFWGHWTELVFVSRWSRVMPNALEHNVF